MTRGRRGSLPLRRRALPSPPPCRFIPALPQVQQPQRHVGIMSAQRSPLVSDPVPSSGTPHDRAAAVERVGAVRLPVRAATSGWCATRYRGVCPVGRRGGAGGAGCRWCAPLAPCLGCTPARPRHPFPSVCVDAPGQEPSAVIQHAGICEGAVHDGAVPTAIWVSSWPRSALTRRWCCRQHTAGRAVGWAAGGAGGSVRVTRRPPRLGLAARNSLR